MPWSSGSTPSRLQVDVVVLLRWDHESGCAVCLLISSTRRDHTLEPCLATRPTVRGQPRGADPPTCSTTRCLRFKLSIWLILLQGLEGNQRRTPAYTKYSYCRPSRCKHSSSPPSARVVGQRELPSLGRGLGWNGDENTALGMIAQSVFSDPARGYGMKSGKFYRLLRLKFTEHHLCRTCVNDLIKDGGGKRCTRMARTF